MFSVAPGEISQQDGVEVVTHVEVHVRGDWGDRGAAKTSPLLSDSPACVTAVLVSSNERMFVLTQLADHPAR